MNREPLFGCDGDCENAHEEDELRVFCGEVLCRGCWEGATWPNTVDAEPDWSDLPPFKSSHLIKNNPEAQWQPIETAPKKGSEE